MALGSAQGSVRFPERLFEQFAQVLIGADTPSHYRVTGAFRAPLIGGVAYQVADLAGALSERAL